MKLKAKFIDWRAGLPVAMLSKKMSMQIGVQTQEMILIKTLSKYPKESTAIIDIMEGKMKDNEILLSSEVKNKLNIKNGEFVDVNIAPVPKSVELIKKKLNNKRLTQKEIEQIIQDIVKERLSEPEIALFVAAMYKSGTSIKETIYMIKAILKTGNRLSLKEKYVVDKHSVGGVAGNRTTPIVVSICAASGLIFPKTSSRSITSAAGTADVMEAVAKVDFTIPELKKILKKAGAFIVWGGSMGIVPADAKLIRVEKSLSIDPKSQLLASIMSKKFAVGSRYILIDIPYGKSAKVKSRKKAEMLERKFRKLGKYFHKKLEVVITNGSEPIGNGVGPVLEMMDIIKILNPREKGPRDLEKKSVFLAGKILEMSDKAKKGKGIELAEKILYSGKAFEKFKQIVKAQQGSLKRLHFAKLKKDIFVKNHGEIVEIDNQKINELARIAGSPVDKRSGIYLHFHVGGSVKKGDKLVTIYSETQARINEATRFFKESKPVKIR